jgi:SNF2 family DNA or RNA helicase
VETKIISVEFSPAERHFYDALHRKSLSLFEGFIQTGTASKSWLAIFSLLHRLRQTCDHVALTIKSHIDQEEWNSNIAQANDEEDSAAGKPKGNSKEGIDKKVRLESSWMMILVCCAFLNCFCWSVSG